jgi:hypothetical protein
VLGHHPDRFPHVPRTQRIAGTQLGVELFEHLSSNAHLLLGSEQANLVAPGVGSHLKLLLQDAERAVAFSVELGGGMVVIEDEGLTDGGVVGDQ